MLAVWPVTQTVTTGVPSFGIFARFCGWKSTARGMLTAPGMWPAAYAPGPRTSMMNGDLPSTSPVASVEAKTVWLPPEVGAAKNSAARAAIWPYIPGGMSSGTKNVLVSTDSVQSPGPLMKLPHPRSKKRTPAKRTTVLFILPPFLRVWHTRKSILEAHSYFHCGARPY